MLLVQRQKIINILLFTIILFCIFFIRKGLIIIYPILVLIYMYLFQLRITVVQTIYLFVLFIVTLISSIIEGFYVANYLFSLYLLLPIFILLTSEVTRHKMFENKKYFEGFFYKFTYLLAIVNFSALIYSQFLISGNQNFEDSFTGLYGASGFGAHTLSIINFSVGIYYFYSQKYIKFVLFLICGVLGFYGLGLILFLAAFFLVFLVHIKQYWRTFMIIMISGIVMVYTLTIINPKNLRYLEKNIEYAELSFKQYDYNSEMSKIRDYKITSVPRFITFIDGAQKRIFKDAKVFFFGVSPGGYNSRTAFYFNGDFMTNKFLKNTFNNRTRYHSMDVYPILNRRYIDRPYNDGTRNQPFSSIVSILLEYGFIIGGLFLFWFFYKIRKIRKRVFIYDKVKSQYIMFLGYFVFLLFIVQNYIEYPEIIFPILIIIKLIEIDCINHQPKKSET